MPERDTKIRPAFRAQFSIATLLFLTTIVAVYCVFSSGNSQRTPRPHTSADRPALVDRIAFVELYVGFEREYNKLEYILTYPGPIEPVYDPRFDLRLVAVVPRDQIEEWVLPEKLGRGTPEPAWHKEAAKEIDVSSVDEWYTDGRSTVGLDRANSIVVWGNCPLYTQ